MFDPRPILGVLVRHEVRFVVIGGIAASLQGSTTITNDFDICYARDHENLERLVRALTELAATLRGPREPVAFRLDARTIKAGLNFTFDTKYGPFDCLGSVAGSFDYEQLRRNSDLMNLVGTNVSVASLDDLIRMKRAAGRNKDLIEVENLSALREVRDSHRRA
ncbi:MAG: hypothetical protein E6J23_05870 [Chloroflexi bacterium]|nr:MAG: hypothetical protein E6J23_05870 [Chloroflexota bacterium]